MKHVLKLCSNERSTLAIQAEKILKIKDVISITSLSRASVYRLAADSRSNFPKPVKISVRASGWKLSSITQWLNGLEAGDSYNGL